MFSSDSAGVGITGTDALVKCQFRYRDGLAICEACGRSLPSRPEVVELLQRNCTANGWRPQREPDMGTGPGACLRDLIAEHGYTAKECGCKSTAAKMNRLGVDGCRREIDSLASEIVANAGKQNVTITVEMACFAIQEACRRAEVAANSETELTYSAVGV